VSSQLWHYTCDHGRAAIGTAGLLKPAQELTTRQLPWPAGFVWLTDLATPNAHALGLTRYLVACDRTAHRYRVTDEQSATPWLAIRRQVPAAWRDELEGAPGAMLRHWYVSSQHVAVVLDERQPGAQLGREAQADA
jgi:hypothetical protein